MMMIGLDLGTRDNLGVAKYQKKTWTCSTVVLAPKQSTRIDERLWRFKNQLYQWFAEGVQVFVYEKPHKKNPKVNIDALLMLEGVLRSECFGQGGIVLVYANIKKVKLHATQNGRAAKPLIVAAAKEKWPDLNITDDNQSDALFILDYAMEKLLKGKQYE